VSDEWFDVAFINEDEAIVHGRRADGSRIRVSLTAEQRAELEALVDNHHRALQHMLESFAA
jgi:DNA-binding MarR family transcriptional regulator